MVRWVGWMQQVGSDWPPFPLLFPLRMWGPCGAWSSCDTSRCARHLSVSVYCKQTPTEATVRTYVRRAYAYGVVQYCSHKMATASTTTPLNTHHRDRATFTLLHLNNQTTPDSHSTSGKHLNTYSIIVSRGHCCISPVAVLTVNLPELTSW